MNLKEHIDFEWSEVSKFAATPYQGFIAGFVAASSFLLEAYEGKRVPKDVESRAFGNR